MFVTQKCFRGMLQKCIKYVLKLKGSVYMQMRSFLSFHLVTKSTWEYCYKFPWFSIYKSHSKEITKFNFIKTARVMGLKHRPHKVGKIKLIYIVPQLEGTNYIAEWKMGSIGMSYFVCHKQFGWSYSLGSWAIVTTVCPNTRSWTKSVSAMQIL